MQTEFFTTLQEALPRGKGFRMSVTSIGHGNPLTVDFLPDGAAQPLQFVANLPVDVKELDDMFMERITKLFQDTAHKAGLEISTPPPPPPAPEAPKPVEKPKPAAKENSSPAQTGIAQRPAQEPAKPAESDDYLAKTKKKGDKVLAAMLADEEFCKLNPEKAAIVKSVVDARAAKKGNGTKPAAEKQLPGQMDLVVEAEKAEAEKAEAAPPPELPKPARHTEQDLKEFERILTNNIEEKKDELYLAKRKKERGATDQDEVINQLEELIEHRNLTLETVLDGTFGVENGKLLVKGACLKQLLS